MAPDHESLLALVPRAASYKVTDGKRLSVSIQPNGKRYWRFRYRWEGQQTTLSCGVFPAVTVDEARSRRNEFRVMLAQGINPSAHIKAGRIDQIIANVRQEAATRFLPDNDGALYFRSGARRLALTPAETHQPRIFLDATRAVTPGVAPCPCAIPRCASSSQSVSPTS